MTRGLDFKAFAHSHWAINTTIRCQHRCVYCFEGKRRGLHDVPADDSERLIEQAAGQVPAVIFMGAEPTLNPNLPRLLTRCRQLGLRASISTNGLRLANRDYLTRLHDAGLTAIEMSFPYPDEHVYERITQARPQGFTRLLAALENIDKLNRAWDYCHPVSVNVVVSRFNVDRLAEVLRHVTSRLTPGTFLLSFKRVQRPGSFDKLAFEQQVLVPVARLRNAFKDLDSVLDPEQIVAFRGFPLCALPGCEHLDADLGYRAANVVVRQNFEAQQHMRDMYPDSDQRRSHPFDWVCEACSLEPLCLQRSLFQDVSLVAGHAPLARLEPIPEPLARWLAEQANGALLLDRPRQRSSLGRLLQGIASVAAPGSVLPGAEVRWAPVDSGVVELTSGSFRGRVRISSLHGAAAPVWRAGHVALADGGGPEPVTWESPGVRQLAAVLEALPEPGPDFAVVGRTVQEAGGGAPRGTAVSRYDPGAWETFLRAVFLPCLTRAAAQFEGLEAERVQDASGPGVMIACHTTGRTRWWGVAPRGGEPAPGFLCGRVRLTPGQQNEEACHDPWTGALYRAVEALESAGAWPDWLPGADGSFLDRAWRIFGSTLLARSGPAGALTAGWVGDAELRLGFVARQVAFEIDLAPAGAKERPYAEGHGIALQFRAPKPAGAPASWMRIVDAFARRLSTEGVPRGL